MASLPSRSHQDYTVGWICALSTELTAAMAMLDEEHQPLSQHLYDDNVYTLGRIGEHNVVIACLPEGHSGNNSAATVAAQMRYSFRGIRLGLMVGIGGGVPSEENDIRLGDVVVSKPGKQDGGVIQYDFGRTVAEDRFIRNGSLNAPPAVLLNAVSALQARHNLRGHRLTQYLSVMNMVRLKAKYTYQGVENDDLFEAEYDHVGGGTTCDQCDKSRLVSRPARDGTEPVIHYGTIASGNQVMRHGATRDRWRLESNVLCFEMEAAGLMNNFPCLVIRGICDYADSHKNKRWQPYAAATAAAYAKELLYVIPGSRVMGTDTANEVDAKPEDLAHGVSGLRKRKRGVDDIDEFRERAQPSAIPNDSYLSLPNLSSSRSVGEKRPPISSTKTSFDSARKARTELTNEESSNHLFNELLHRAVTEGDRVMAQRLLDSGADVSAVDKDGDTSLYIAAREAHQTIVQLLLDHGAEVTTPNRNEFATPVHISAILGRKAITQQLLGHCASLHELLSAGNKDQDTALHLAVWGDHKSTVDLLIQHGADVNSTNKNLETPLHFAAQIGSLAIAKFLLKEGAGVNAPTKKGDTPLHICAWWGHKSVARILLKNGANLEAKGKDEDTPLHVSVWYQHRDVVKCLLDSGAYISAVNKFGKTALHLAAQNGDEKLTKMLLTILEKYEGPAGVSTAISATDVYGNTPFHLCAYNGSTAVAHLLLQRGSASLLSLHNGDQDTSLHLAAWEGNTAMVKLLLDNGAEVDVRGDEMYTPLHYAATRGHGLIADLLCEHGANAHALNKENMTPKQLAELNEKPIPKSLVAHCKGVAGPREKKGQGSGGRATVEVLIKQPINHK